mgnify:FL=1|jgi:hypothetical protein|tara:strand:- start:36 stop:365 length:330 start_codon:yes stop_codon:yes gene_type:complete
MSKLLATNLPLELGDSVTPLTYNKLVRILELNLGQFDPDSIRQIDGETLNKVNFNAGSIIWNTTIEALQVYTGNKWENISTPNNPLGFELTGSVGKVSVVNKGDTTIKI